MDAGRSILGSEVPSAAVDRPDLTLFFKPRGVVVFGSIVDAPSANDRYLRFGCPVYLVNPRGGVHSMFPVRTCLEDVPGDIDLALIRTAPATAIALLDECGARGIRSALVFSSGFSEVGGDGLVYEAQLAATARRHGIRILGPNTNENAFEQFEAPTHPNRGRIGLITQSGHNGRPVVQGQVIGAAFSRWIASGNEADLEAGHFIRYFAEDPATAVIAGYIEGFRNFASLRDGLACANEHDKPVVLLKIGATDRAAASAVSHTGHMAGSDAVIGGLFRQHGVTRVQDLDELCETANLFSKLPHGVGPRAALYSISGGSCILMTEVAASYGIEIPHLEAETQERLHQLIRWDLSVANPIDNGAFFGVRSQSERLEVLDIIASDPNIDFLVIAITGAVPGLSDSFANDIFAWAPTAPKPVIATWNSYQTDDPGFRRLVASGVPVFRSFRTCFSALQAYAEHQRWREAKRARPVQAQGPALPELARIGTVDAAVAASLLAAAGVTFAQERLVTTPSAARQAFEQLGGSVAMKLISRDFPHKTDAGLVALQIDATAVEATFENLLAKARLARPDAVIEGVQVQEQVAPGVELLVGLARDEAAGMAMTIGAGGIYTEILADVAVRPLPVDELDLREMLSSLKVARILAGARGRPPANIQSFIDLALAVARFGEAHQAQIKELDLNPVVVSAERAIAVDVLIVADGA